MCLYPRLIKNKKYVGNKKNGGQPPPIKDERTLLVPIGCQKCMECRKQKAREWQVRLLEDIKTNKNGKFITLTFSSESIKELDAAVTDIENTKRKNKKEEDIRLKRGKSEGYERDNRIATLGVRRFLERYRKEYKKSIRHWLITELGGNGTENVHLHGIIWIDDIEKIKKHWNYGYIWDGKMVKGKKVNYVNEQTVNYITKYVTKVDFKHKEYKGKILTSSGIGKEYTNGSNSQGNKYTTGKTDETYRTRTGHKMALPIYYRNKLYTENERESLWLEKLDKEVRYVKGNKIDISKGEDIYFSTLKYYQELNVELGYGDGYKDDWKQKEYENDRRNIMRRERINKVELSKDQ